MIYISRVKLTYEKIGGQKGEYTLYILIPTGLGWPWHMLDGASLMLEKCDREAL